MTNVIAPLPAVPPLPKLIKWARLEDRVKMQTILMSDSNRVSVTVKGLNTSGLEVLTRFQAELIPPDLDQQEYDEGVESILSDAWLLWKSFEKPEE